MDEMPKQRHWCVYIASWISHCLIPIGYSEHCGRRRITMRTVYLYQHHNLDIGRPDCVACGRTTVRVSSHEPSNGCSFHLTSRGQNAWHIFYCTRPPVESRQVIHELIGAVHWLTVPVRTMGARAHSFDTLWSCWEIVLLPPRETWTHVATRWKQQGGFGFLLNKVFVRVV